MFDEGQRLPSPYHRTKFESERIVREQPYVPWRVYRPGIVVGDSQTGEMDKIDGPYYFFKAIQRMRHLLPEWVPLVGLDLGYTNVVPVDWVAGALEHIAHEPDLDGRAFHLTDPRPQRVDELHQRARRRRARAALRGERRQTLIDPLPKWPLTLAAALPPFAPGRATSRCASSASREEVLAHMELVPRFDTREAARALAGSPLETAAAADATTSPRLWDYWEREMDADTGRGRTLKEALDGKHVMITGASSGIGRSTALKVAAAGGVPLLVARNVDKLEEVRAEIVAGGGTAYVYAADISDMESIERLLERVLADHRNVDMLVNNAGPLDPALDRAQLRPLPRLRTHDAAQLLRRGQADHRPAAAHARARLRPHRQRLLDRRADQPAALLRLRRLEGGARRLHPRRRLGGDRRRRDVHDDPHAARAHADDRADEDVRRVPRDQPGRGRGHDLRGDAQPPQADGHAHRASSAKSPTR